MSDFLLKRIALGVDLEEFQGNSQPAGHRCAALPNLVNSLLEAFDRHSAKATFFCVGQTAEKFPELVRSISDQGHEIASHSYAHIPLSRLDPLTFESDLARSLDTLNSLTRQPIVGYRAPLLSLTPATQWAYPILEKAGILYSSSVLPAENVQFGWGTHPRTPTKHDGLTEYPISVMRFFGRLYPLIGGAYFRVIPRRSIFRALSEQAQEELITTYFHPYDFDTHQPYAVHRELANRPWLAPILFLNRKNFFVRLDELLDHCEKFVTFAQYHREFSPK